MPGDEAGVLATQTDAEPVTPAPEGETAAPKEESTQVEQPKTFTQAELDALVQKRVGREQRRYNREIGELRGRLSSVETQKPQPQAPTELKPEEFASHEAYIEARATRAAVEAVSRLEQQRVAQTSQQAEQQRLQELGRNFSVSEDAARDKYDDYDDVFETIPRGSLKPQVVEYLGEIKNGAEMLYHLANEPKELARIARLSPTAAIRELVLRESQIETTEKRTSKAPPPPGQLGGRSVSADDIPDARKDSLEVWMKKRDAQERANRNR
jgi:hypothetical protein